MDYFISTQYRKDLPELAIGDSPSEEVKLYLKQAYEKLYQYMDDQIPAKRQLRFLTYCMDRLVGELFLYASRRLSQQKGVGHLAIFAQGGFGRKELNLYSDIDLIFIFDKQAKTIAQEFSKEILYPLWDAGLKVGYATRDLRDSKRLLKEDLSALSSMMDSRLIIGDDAIAEKYLKLLGSILNSRTFSKNFIEHKMQEKEERILKFGHSVYLGEPNIKESEGGLRDWHLVHYILLSYLHTKEMGDWVRRHFLTEEEADELERALNFLWLTRNHLHRQSGRNNDKLVFERQEKIALKMGFEDTQENLAVEKFMQSYYNHAASINKIASEVIRRVSHQQKNIFQRLKAQFSVKLDDIFEIQSQKIIARDLKKLEASPLALLKAFVYFQNLKLPLEEGLTYWIQTHLDLIGESYLKRPEVKKIIIKMFNKLDYLGKTIKVMHGCGFWGRLLPEFEQIHYQPQHDIYHFYTVDTHLILAVEELSKLASGFYDEAFPFYRKVLDEVERPDLLAWGVLFHDIGKGKGGDHSGKGAEIATAVLRRLEYSDQEQKIVDFLVRSHLIMSHVSQRRDLEDPNFVKSFAETFESKTQLDLLFLLTWADIRAIGPKVWSAWKGSLLESLYQKVRELLTGGEALEDKFRQIAQGRKGDVLKNCEEHNLSEEYYFFNSLPPRYFYVHSHETIKKHLALVKNIGNETFTLEVFHDEEKEISRAMIFTQQNFEILSRVSGVLASCGMNILSLVQYVSSSGGALILLRLADSRGKPLGSDRIWNQFSQRLDQVLRGKMNAADLFSVHKKSSFLFPKIGRKLPAKINIDNDLSAYYTVIEIFANDRLGLLYEILSTLERLGIFIDISKISTEVDQIADILYVKDIFGKKIREKEKLELIKRELMAVVCDEELKEAKGGE